MQPGEALGDVLQILIALEEKIQLGELMEPQEQLHAAGHYPFRIIWFCYPSVKLSAHRHSHDIELTQPDGHWAY